MITLKFSLYNKNSFKLLLFFNGFRKYCCFLDIYFIMFYNYYVLYKKIFVIKFLLSH